MTEIDLMRAAAAEIRHLRNQNMIMSTRLNMYDQMMALFHAEVPRNGVGMSEDIAWAIDKHIEQKEKSQGA